jgi:predicted solute-binding protein
MSWYTQRIDVVSRVLEHAQYEDKALRAAWRNRMHRRHDDILTRVVDRIHAEGDLAAGWKSTTAIDLIYAVTMPGVWRELSAELGWSQPRYAKHVFDMLERAFLRR